MLPALRRTGLYKTVNGFRRVVEAHVMEWLQGAGEAVFADRCSPRITISGNIVQGEIVDSWGSMLMGKNFIWFSTGLLFFSFTPS